MKFSLTSLFPKEYLNVNRVRGFMLSGLEEFGKKMKETADSTVENWDHDVDFSVEVRYASGVASVTVSTDSELWQMLNEGTSVRWAVMRPPYYAKTSANSLATNSGVRTTRGGYYTAVRGSKAMAGRNIAARPGIEPRNFSTLILEEHMPDLPEVVNEAIRKGLG